MVATVKSTFEIPRVAVLSMIVAIVKSAFKISRVAVLSMTVAIVKSVLKIYKVQVSRYLTLMGLIVQYLV